MALETDLVAGIETARYWRIARLSGAQMRPLMWCDDEILDVPTHVARCRKEILIERFPHLAHLHPNAAPGPGHIAQCRCGLYACSAPTDLIRFAARHRRRRPLVIYGVTLRGDVAPGQFTWGDPPVVMRAEFAKVVGPITVWSEWGEDDPVSDELYAAADGLVHYVTGSVEDLRAALDSMGVFPPLDSARQVHRVGKIPRPDE